MNAQLAIDFTAAKQARDTGMTRATNHADAVSADWSERAYRMLCQHARIGNAFTSYDFRQTLHGFLEEPPTPKAFGSVFTRAAKAGVIKKVGYAQHPERHASPTVLWKAA